MKAKPQPLEPGDFYFNEQELMVFTAQYHLRRGFCCQSGCKHCPFGSKKSAPSGHPDESKKGAENG
ncbi:DUF5522 domain-containing protein [Rufibacter soli]|jgi:hypothetical protein